MKIRNLLHIPPAKYPVRSILKWLWRSWRGNRTQAILNAVVGLVSVGVSLLQVWAVQHAIDVASGVVQGSLYTAIGLMGALILCDFAISIATVWIRNILGIKAQNRMQQRMLDRILRSVWGGREQFHSGDVLNRLEADVNNVVGFLTEVIPNTLSVLALFVGAFCYLFSMDRWLAVAIVAILPIFLAVSKIYIGRMRNLNRQVRESDSRVQSLLQETLQHRMLIKTLESDDTMIDRLEGQQGELRRRVIHRTRFSVFSYLMVNLGFSLGYLLAFFWAAVRLASHTLSFGGMTAFLQLVNRIQNPARSLVNLVPSFVSVFTAAERLMELEENPLEEQGDPVELPAPCGIRLHNVTYGYADVENNVIERLDFDFTPGSCTAVKGETGAGKTTLIRLLLALVRPKTGAIEIYHGDRSERLSPLHRCNFVYVPQGNTLLSGTIRENLLLGKTNATDEEMEDALRQSCADFVFDLPDGLDTVCGEQGAGLSEGQAQRIGIARSLLRPGSILVLDEATSALDLDTEKQLLHNILSSQHKTVIFITHRPAVLDYCDQTLEISKIPS
uniref:ABC transporter ATP-binding protein n=1 Tax=Prevotella sp. GTC17259 TaxID=3236795 RepID=A0AB33J3K7_9BACT